MGPTATGSLSTFIPSPDSRDVVESGCDAVFASAGTIVVDDCCIDVDVDADVAAGAEVEVECCSGTVTGGARLVTSRCVAMIVVVFL